MAKSKKEKVESVAEILAAVRGALTTVFVGFTKLTVAEVTRLRRKLRTGGVGYRVVKKTLARRALEDSGVSGNTPDLPGKVAFAYFPSGRDASGDTLFPAREIWAAGKELEGKITILGGIFGGVYKTKDEMVSLATIPPRETLIAQFVNIINSPIQGFVVGLDQIAKRKN